MNRFHFFSLLIVLSVFGLSIFLYKTFMLGFPVNPDGTSQVWKVENKIRLEGNGQPAQISMFAPQTTHPYLITTESFVGRDYGVIHKRVGPNRVVVWAKEEADGLQTLYYRGVTRKLDRWETREQEIIDTADALKNSQGELPPLEGVFLEAGLALITDAKKQSVDTESLVLNLLGRFTKENPDSHEALLLSQQPLPTTLGQVLTLHGTPARVVHGIRLPNEPKTVTLHTWLEVWENKEWTPFDLEQAKKGVPENYFPWWRGHVPMFHIEGGTLRDFRVSVTPSREDAIKAAVERGKIINPAWLKFSLFSLPVETQVTYHILILIPVGAFLIVIFRNIVGLKTFGTFMPILIALAFRETELFWGIILFSLLVGLGLAARFWLEHLKLLLVPRLASVLTIVVVMMGTLSVLFQNLGIIHGLSVALFPMVIVTMTIERMSIVWDERGPGEAFQQAFGSMAVASLSFMIMSIPLVDYLFFTFPELLLVLLAGTIALGRYSGYRLLELRRFKGLLNQP